MPDLVPPMLPATGELADATDASRWAVEFGWEGHRCVAYVRPDRVRLLSSTARSVTGSFPELGALAAQGPPGGMVLDGTVVALDEAGRPSRGPLLRRTATVAPEAALRAEVPVGYVVTDLLWADGRRVLELPYRRRRAALEELGLGGPSILVPPSFGLDEADLVARTAEHYGLDGLHLKRLDVAYQPGRRTRNWLRVPLRRRRQVLVAGWVPAGRAGWDRRERIAAVLLALPGPDGPRYVGRVGMGAADADAGTIAGARGGAGTRAPADVPAEIAGEARWVVPGLVAAVEHRGWTAAGRLALPAYRGLVPPEDQDPELTPGPGARSGADSWSTGSGIPDQSSVSRATAGGSVARDPRLGAGGGTGAGGDSARSDAPSSEGAAGQGATGDGAAGVGSGDGVAAWHGPLSRRLEQHFVYNTLNTIASLVRTDPPRARELLLGFADLSRAADRADAPESRLDEELAAVRAYLQIERTRFGARLDTEVDDPAAAGIDPAAPVLPLSLLAAVRRAVQERIEPEPRGGAVAVRFGIEDGRPSCRVEVRVAGDSPDTADGPFVLFRVPLVAPVPE
ncbi:histidine kinase [Pseudonocardia nematodicida]|uniref:DNA ligase (ATP) n=1 Tax=Pseudonocardia nematodicida TaxID=1206997 RepID=A0ABV1K4C3_9PSEU